MPVVLEPETGKLPHTETEPRPQRERWKWISRFPWPRGQTRNAAPTDDDELIVDNQTFAAWCVYLGYRDLGVVLPHRKLKERVVKTGLLNVRPLDAPTGTAYLTAYLRPAIHTVEIRSQIAGNQPVYDLRLVEGAR